jgi:hypothetical protein
VCWIIGYTEVVLVKRPFYLLPLTSIETQGLKRGAGDGRACDLVGR